MAAVPAYAKTPLVLVVDNASVVAAQRAEGLEAFGFRVEVAHRAREALDIISTASDIPAVVSDPRMPGGDGLRLARDIHAARCVAGFRPENM